MAVSKVVYGDEVLIDLTADTIKADTLVVGYTAHGADGNTIVGTNPYEKTATDAEVSTQADIIADILEVLRSKLNG